MRLVDIGSASVRVRVLVRVSWKLALKTLSTKSYTYSAHDAWGYAPLRVSIVHENMVKRGSLLADLICCFNYSNIIVLVRTRTVMCFALCRKFNAQMACMSSTQGSHPC